MHNLSRCVEINKRFPGLLPAILSAYAIQSASKPGPAKSVRRPSRAVTKVTAKR
jgi:hypothetical protein